VAASNNKCRIRKDDQVVVIAGKEKGQVGRVVKVLPATRQVVVEGVRVGFKLLDNGDKVRIDRRTGAVLDNG